MAKASGLTDWKHAAKQFNERKTGKKVCSKYIFMNEIEKVSKSSFFTKKKKHMIID